MGFEEIGIDVDHLHLHVLIPPGYAVSKVVETLKSITSKRIKDEFSHFLKKVYWDGRGIWGRGFFVSTVGAKEAVTKNHIRYQGRQDAGQPQLAL